MHGRLLLIIGMLLMMFGGAAVCRGQPAMPPVPDATQAPPVGGETATAPGTVYPPDPLPFIRGNPTAPGTFTYISVWKLAFVLSLLLLWTHYANWASEDSRGLKVRPVFWNTLIFLGGLLGMLTFLTMPRYSLGLLLGMV